MFIQDLSTVTALNTQLTKLRKVAKNIESQKALYLSHSNCDGANNYVVDLNPDELILVKNLINNKITLVIERLTTLGVQV